MITVSIDGLFAPMVEDGLPRDRLEAVASDLRNAHRELMSRRGKDVGFYDAALKTDVVKAVGTEVARLRSQADDLFVLGIGGSSLGGQALCAALGSTADRSVRLHFIDNVDPDTFAILLDRLDPARTAAAVITKSGSTVETLAQLMIIRRWFRVTLGQGESRSRMVFVTDPEKGLLRELAQSEGIRAFEIPPNIGGRYSALTPVGLLPAAFLGIDIDKVIGGAADMVERVTADDVLENPACLFAAGAVLAGREMSRSTLVMLPYSDALRTTSAWFVHLWAESLGKRVNRLGEEVHAGQTPLAAIGATDQHSQLQLLVEGPRNKVVVIVRVEKNRHLLPIPPELDDRCEVTFLHGRDLGEVLDAERRATRAALLDAGVPVIDVTLPAVDEANFGGLLILLEAACACTGLMMGINPFDQPGVEAGKRMALGLLGRSGYDDAAQRVLNREARGSDEPDNSGAR